MAPSREPAPAHRRRWIVNVLGGGDQRGRWYPGRDVRVLSILGGGDVDLRGPEPGPGAPVVRVHRYGALVSGDVRRKRPGEGRRSRPWGPHRPPRPPRLP